MSTVVRSLVLTVAASLIGPASLAQDVDAPADAWLTTRVDRAIDGLADRLLYDPEAARSWVAAEVALEDYAGSMKGARGALLTMAANDIDQAVLLGALLDRSLVRHRWATCPWDGPRIPSARPPSTILLEHATAIAEHIDDPDIRDEILEVGRIASSQRAASDRWAADLLATLASSDMDEVLGAGGWTADTPAADPSGETASRSASTSRLHLWVQASRGTEWHDLDTTTPDGRPPCTATDTYDVLPSELVHRLDIGVDVEQLVDGTLTTTTQTLADLALPDVATAAVAVGFSDPMPIPKRDGVRVRRLTPVLQVDGRWMPGQPMVVPAASEDLSIEDTLDEAAGVLSTRPSPTSGGVEPDPVTAAWLRLELRGPEGDPRVLRSELFDRIGPAVRATGAATAADVRPLEEADGLYADFEAAWGIGLLMGEQRTDGPASDELVETEAIAPGLDAVLRLFPAAQRYMGRTTSVGATTTPAVLVLGVSPRERAGEVRIRFTFDVLEVPAGEAPDTGDATTTADSEATPSRMGSAAREAAAILGAETFLGALVGSPTGGIDDTAGVLDAVAADGIAWRLLAPGDRPEIDGATADALARIDRQLAQGNRLLVPATAPERDGRRGLAWWVIDPVAGTIRDEHQSGRHTALPEEGRQTSEASAWSRHYRRVGRCLTVIAFVAGGLAGYAGAPPSTDATVLDAAEEILDKMAKNRKPGEDAARGCR